MIAMGRKKKIDTSNFQFNESVEDMKASFLSLFDHCKLKKRKMARLVVDNLPLPPTNNDFISINTLIDSLLLYQRVMQKLDEEIEVHNSQGKQPSKFFATRNNLVKEINMIASNYGLSVDSRRRLMQSELEENMDEADPVLQILKDIKGAN